MTKASQVYGRFKAWSTAITATFVGIILIIIFTNMYNDNKKFETVNARVVQSNCTSYTQTKKTQSKKNTIETTKTLYDCNLLLNYNVKGQEYTSNYKKEELSDEIQVGTELKIDYNTEDPTKITEGASMTVYGAMAGIIFMLFVIFLSYLNVYLVMTSNTIAGVQGTIGFASNLRSALTRNRNN